MNWKFWKKQDAGSGGSATAIKFDKPKDLPDAVGRKMVVEMNMDPDLVWSLKYVSRPLEGNSKNREFRIYNPSKVNLAGLVVKNWTSLDERPELVMHTGQFDRSSGQVKFHDA
ncbi:hypothetical protein Dvar_70840 [Desulfosarcina variabilis str. Montpellier]|uniref:hypothetical protein n=1 Tax=Desulfosarcina variabilis TaxID=2300 RepID=UPI003AFAEB02